MRLQPGAEFAGYTVVSRLGRGGMATVYLVREPGLERNVALKVLPEDLVDDTEFAARFTQEAQVVANLDHPNIIPLYRYGITSDVPWMALRYVDGGDLAHRLQDRPLAVADGLAILRAVASALDYAHRRGIVHRDLKPQNVLLTTDGAAYLADFGVAKLLEGVGRLKTATGGTLGTPAYMAPEQAQGFKLGPYTDLYALAIIAFQWLTGRLPFDADTPHAILVKQVAEPVPTDALRALPPAVAAVLQRGLAKRPEDRQASAGAFVAELEQALYADATMPRAAVAAPASVPAPAPPPVALPPAASADTHVRSKRVSPAVVVAVVLAVAFAGYAAWRETRPPPAPAPAVVVPAPVQPAPATPPDPRVTPPAPAEPVAAPTAPAPAMAEPPPPAPARSRVDELVDAHVAALGGAQRIRGLRSWRIEGEASGQGAVLSYRTEIERPRKVVVEMYGPGVSLRQGTDGHTYWFRNEVGGYPTSGVLPPDDAKVLAAVADLDGLVLDWRARGRQVTYAGTEHIDGVAAEGLEVVHANGDRNVLYLHPRTFLPMRVTYTYRTGGVAYERETDYRDYTTFDGIPLPRVQESGPRGGARDTRITIDSARSNVAIDDSRFSAF